MQDRCVRNRKRSQRRRIFCPVHGCFLDSVSQKYPLYTESPERLRQAGFHRVSALMLIASRTAVPLEGEWLEAFWCGECQGTTWYYVRRLGPRQYEVVRAPEQLWQQVSGVINPGGNPSVGEFTRRQARAERYGGVKDFGLL